MCSLLVRLRNQKLSDINSEIGVSPLTVWYCKQRNIRLVSWVLGYKVILVRHLVLCLCSIYNPDFTIDIKS